jgi:2-(1,2-epoxy-1,2-dihydrophenyl)acetyl-CoA isomerase
VSAAVADRALIVERRGHVAILTLNRPEKLNAIDPPLKDRLHDALDELGAAFPEIRVVVLTGSGRGFCSGADVSSMAKHVGALARSGPPRRRIVHLGPALRRLPQPVVAAVNGVAAGAGLSLALASEIRVASSEARFSCVFVKRALVPDTGASYLLPQTVGRGLAAEMALTGRVYPADWALAAGLVNAVVPPEELMPHALAIADEIAANPPITVRSIKSLMARFDVDLDEVVAVETAINDEHDATEDRREAMRSFVEKRAPVYHGR